MSHAVFKLPVAEYKGHAKAEDVKTVLTRDLEVSPSTIALYLVDFAHGSPRVMTPHAGNLRSSILRGRV